MIKLNANETNALMDHYHTRFNTFIFEFVWAASVMKDYVLDHKRFDGLSI